MTAQPLEPPEYAADPRHLTWKYSGIEQTTWTEEDQ